MSTLTWRDVAAPDFRSSMDGYRAFSDMLGSAFNGAERGLNKFDDSISSDANARVNAHLLQYTDPVAYKAALADGSVWDGQDVTRLTPETMRTASARSSDLLNQSVAEENLGYSQYQHGRTKSINTAEDALAPIEAQAMSLRYAGKNDEADALLAAHPELTKGIPLATATGLVKDNFDASKGYVGLQGDILGNRGKEISNAGGLISNEANKFSLESNKTTWQESRQASQIAAEIMGSAETPADAEQLLNTNPKYKGLTGPVAMAVRQALGISTLGSSNTGLMNMDTTSLGGTGGTGGSRVGNPADTVFGYGQFASPDKPLSSMSMGDVQSFQKDKLIPATRGKVGAGPGMGTGAVGAYQLTYDTLQKYGQQIFGKNFASTPFTMANQDKIAEAVWNDARKGNLHDVWASLPANAPGQYANVPWSQVRDKIIQNEGTGDPRLVRLAGSAAGDALKYSLAKQGAQNPLAGVDWEAVYKDESNVSQVADKLIAKGGALSGTNKTAMVNVLNSIMQRGNVKPAVAAAIVERNIAGSDQYHLAIIPRGIKQLFGGNATSNLGNGLRINDEGVTASLAQLKNPNQLMNELTTKESNTNDYTATTQARQLYDQALAAYQARVQQKSIKPDLDMTMVTRNLQAAEANVAAVSARANSNFKTDNGLNDPAPVPTSVAQTVGKPNVAPTQRRVPAELIAAVAASHGQYSGPLSKGLPPGRAALWAAALNR